MISILPELLEAQLSYAEAKLAFSGYRSLDTIDRDMLQAVIAAVHPRAGVAVGDSSGVDYEIKQAFPGSRFFQRTANTPAAYAARSIRLARFVAAQNYQLIAFPGAACPPRVWPTVHPSHAFNGSGSGTWATVALAVGLGAHVWVCLPDGADSPPWHSVTIEPMGAQWLFIEGKNPL